MIADLQRRFGGGDWQPVTVGKSHAGVWTDGRIYIKTGPLVAHRDSGFSLRAEADRAAWLRSVGVTAPEIIEYGTDGTAEWLVTRALAGRDASAPSPVERRARVVDGLAEVAAVLHALPVTDCPFGRSLAVTIPDALHAMSHNLVNLHDLDAVRSG